MQTRYAFATTESLLELYSARDKRFYEAYEAHLAGEKPRSIERKYGIDPRVVYDWRSPSKPKTPKIWRELNRIKPFLEFDLSHAKARAINKLLVLAFYGGMVSSKRISFSTPDEASREYVQKLLKKIGLPKEAAIKHSRQTSRNPNARNGVTLDYSPLAKFFLAALSRLDLPGNRRALGIIEGEPLKTFGHQIKHANGITVLPHVQAQSRIAETGETPEERGIAARGLRDSLEALVSVRAFTRKTKGHVILNLPLVDRQKKAAETALTAKKLVERAYGLNGLTAAILTHKNRRTGKVKGYSPYLLIPKEQVPTFLKAIKRHNRHAPFLKRQA